MMGAKNETLHGGIGLDSRTFLQLRGYHSFLLTVTVT